MLIHHLLPSPTPFSHLQHLQNFGWKTGRSPKVRRNPVATEHEDGVEERLARARETERERGSDGVLGRARQLRLPTMAAQGGLHLRVSSRRRRKTTSREREAERRSVTGRYALRSSAPTREERKRETERGSSTDRPTIACSTC